MLGSLRPTGRPIRPNRRNLRAILRALRIPDFLSPLSGRYFRSLVRVQVGEFVGAVRRTVFHPLLGTSMYCVYVLENAAGRFYVGQTSNITDRLDAHNAPLSDGVTYPRKHGPWQLVYTEYYPTRSEAMQRERYIKRMKSSRWIRRELLDRDSAGG